MSKKIFFIGLVCCTALIIISCKKSDPAPAPVISPAESAPINTAFNKPAIYTITVGGSGNWEFGVKFGVISNGKITKLACKMPLAGSYRVTLWETSLIADAIIGQATVTQSANGTIAYSAITPVALTTGKNYVVSIWRSGNWYQVMLIAGGNITYPIIQGSIFIKGFQYAPVPQTPATFPSIIAPDFVSGLVDFEFQPD